MRGPRRARFWRGGVPTDVHSRSRGSPARAVVARARGWEAMNLEPKPAPLPQFRGLRSRSWRLSYFFVRSEAMAAPNVLTFIYNSPSTNSLSVDGEKKKGLQAGLVIRLKAQARI
jgi:hypothetical protein